MIFRNWTSALGRATALLLTITLFAACSGNGASPGTNSGNEGTPAASLAASANSSPAPAGGPESRSITDFLDRTIEIPAQPQKIVYVGSSPGDLLALGIKPVGASLGVIGVQVAYPDLLGGIEDIGGNEVSMEKILALEPDLIFIDAMFYADAETVEAFMKIAPTVAFDSNAPMYERLRFMADTAGKKAEAEAWITEYEAKAEEVIKKLGITPGDTATVLLQLGKQLYVMGKRGLAVTIYDVLKYEPAPKAKEIIDQSLRFVDISNEVLPEYAGDWIFLLSNSSNQETAEATKALTESALWNTISAVKNGQVYSLGSKWNFDDPVTRERLLDELPRAMDK